MTLEMERPTIQVAKPELDAKFSKVWEDNRFKIYGYLMRRVHHPQIAEDLTGDIFLNAYAGFPRYEDRGVPITVWLHRIARNTIVSYLRKPENSLHENPTLPLDEYVKGKGMKDLTSPMDDLTDPYEAQRATQALATLTEAQKEVVLLRLVEEKTVRETARILGKQENNVHVLQHKGVASLRKKFNELNSPPQE